MEEKKLYRNEHDKVLGGVSSGVADYMQVDVTIIRILFVLATIFLAGTGLIAYLVMWIMLPVKNDPAAKFSKFNDYFKNNPNSFDMFNSPNAFSNPQNSGTQTKWNTENTNFGQQPDFSKFNKSNDTSKTVVGLILLVLGVYFLLRQMGWVPYWFNIFHVWKLWPLAIIAVGVSLIFKNRQKAEWKDFNRNNPTQQTTETKVEDAVVVTEEPKKEDQAGL